jgi:thioredoxin reductase (NADPH)
LAEMTRHVYVLVRSASLATSMSRYLIRRIEESPNVIVLSHTEIIALEGNHHLDSVRWRNSQTGHTEKHNIKHIFVMTGANPNTGWLNGCLALDAKGFINTGPDLSPENLSASGWSLKRQPYLLETSLPGVFAAGDVRSSSIKRVASAVGEGQPRSHLFIKYSRNRNYPNQNSCYHALVPALIHEEVWIISFPKLI